MVNKAFTKRESEIIHLLQESGALGAIQITEKIGISKQRFYIIIKPLLKQEIIYKVGTVPNVFYIFRDTKNAIVYAKEVRNIEEESTIGVDNAKIIENSFYTINPDGSESFGMQAFTNWCHRRHENVNKTAINYVNTLEKYNKHKNSTGLIDATDKLKSSFENVYIKSMKYIDFYSIERYGKTRLGQMILYAKKSENKILSNRVSDEAMPKIIHFIKEKGINAVTFIPPTEHRKYQFMYVLRERFNNSLPIIELVKIKTSVLVPQKTLSKIEDRIINAKNTIFIKRVSFLIKNREGKEKVDDYLYDKVLLIDDAVGSGSTFNEVAKKIKDQKIAHTVYAMAIVGSFNGFEVVKEA